ncbi:hypothetical protein [Ruegeria arenilitoris]|uniref:hypothetical protein n=1 Tax=Ruegeria arenilitoris TaxID=1173585 RepID=UPI00147CBD3E|nr:hypothetical protein [Ruegeria arenilitoris]
MHDKAVQAAISVMENHLIALNARDPEAIAKTLHFPHFRLAGNVMKVWETPDSYMDDFYARAGDAWGHTEWGHLTPLQTSPEKVHLDVMVNRFDKDGAPLVAFPSLWVVTQIGGFWAAQLRSSFASDLG